jgi:hypothetical protein
MATNKDFAFYAASLYRLGNYTDAALMSAILFEREILDRMNDAGLNKIYKDYKGNKKNRTLQMMIDELTINDKSSKYALQHIRSIRNKITHESNVYDLKQLHDVKQKDIMQMVREVWRYFDNSSYQNYDGDVNRIDRLKADYHVVGIREIFDDELLPENQFRKITNKDFNDLFKLRDKIHCLSTMIEDDILDNSQHNIHIDLISKVDTTSAYVWMPMTMRNKQREKITSASASILATPQDFRIYIDLGGAAYSIREQYYDFLSSNELANLLGKDKPDGLKVFSNDWFCFFTEEPRNISVLSDTDKIQNEIKLAREKLLSFKETDILTWNRLLIGYVIPRKEIPYDEIKSKLEYIIELYVSFEKYRKNIS